MIVTNLVSLHWFSGTHYNLWNFTFPLIILLINIHNREPAPKVELFFYVGGIQTGRREEKWEILEMREHLSVEVEVVVEACVCLYSASAWPKKHVVKFLPGHRILS